MKPEELRINNYLLYNGAIVQVTGVDSEYVYLNIVTLDYVKHDEVEPVPLTEEWLINLGLNLYAEKNEISIPVDIAVKHPLCLRFLANEWTLFIKEGGGYFKAIKYLHQLQNLYFALTGEELTLNTPQP